jgi:hypothetical protein
MRKDRTDYNALTRFKRDFVNSTSIELKLVGGWLVAAPQTSSVTKGEQGTGAS